MKALKIFLSPFLFVSNFNQQEWIMENEYLYKDLNFEINGCAYGAFKEGASDSMSRDITNSFINTCSTKD